MHRPQSPRAWPAAAGFALAVAWLVAPATVPVYDGIGNPDEPYRYVVPAAGAKDTAPPDTARESVPVEAGRNTAIYVNTAEVGPQLSLYLPAGALAAPVGAERLEVVATPLAPPSALPPDGRIVGNVYRLTATAGGRPADLIGLQDQLPVLDMRAPTGAQPGPVFEHFDGERWSRATTTRVGVDVYRTRVPALGEWALVRLDRHRAGGSTSTALWLVPGVLVLALGGAVLAVRRRHAAQGTTVV